ncbi:MAG: hypothetical protein K2Q27_00965, partial [Novosphingobium sp.]|nr:hypothetical protein [Novosphingobium sp.]MBY0391814.1 hypothetical protein [Novosphingobium sp.]
MIRSHVEHHGPTRKSARSPSPLYGLARGALRATDKRSRSCGVRPVRPFVKEYGMDRSQKAESVAFLTEVFNEA